MSGGPEGAAAGTLASKVGGDTKSFSKVEAIIDTFSSKMWHLGPPGSGMLVKSMNNSMLGAHVLIASEALATIVRHGVNLDDALEAINSSSGRSLVTEKRFPINVVGGEAYGFKLGMHCKDMENALQTVRAASGQHGREAASAGGVAAKAPTAPIPSPMLHLAHDLMNMARQHMGEDAEHVETVRLAERAHGITFLRNKDTKPRI